MVSGKVKLGNENIKEREYLEKLILKENKIDSTAIQNQLQLETREVYKELKLRGYCYTGLFQGINNVNLDGELIK